jgi:GPI mannosyltransferase 1 subunit M
VNEVFGVRWAGKVLLSVADAAVGAVLVALWGRAGWSAGGSCVAGLLLWALNPLPAVVATRGNADALAALLVLGVLAAAREPRRALLSGALLGAAVHLRLFPLVFGPALALHAAGGWRVWRPAPLGLALAAAASTAALSAVAGACYGRAYWHEALLHHLVRADARHNFAMHFYALYLATPRTRLAAALGAFGPQLLLALALAAAHARARPPPLEWTLFALTWVFVAFNKVVTMQYAVWHLALLAAALPALSRLGVRAAVGLGALWAGAHGLWLAAAYLLEFRGRAVFAAVWAASGVVLLVNALVLRVLMRAVAAAPAPPGPRSRKQHSS